MSALIARFCPALEAWLELADWPAQRLCAGVWHFADDAIPADRRALLPELADDLLAIEHELEPSRSPEVLAERCLRATPTGPPLEVAALGRGLRPAATALRRALGTRAAGARLLAAASPTGGEPSSYRSVSDRTDTGTVPDLLAAASRIGANPSSYRQFFDRADTGIAPGEEFGPSLGEDFGPSPGGPPGAVAGGQALAGEPRIVLLGRDAVWVCTARQPGNDDRLGTRVGGALRAGPAVARSELKWSALRPRAEALGYAVDAVDHWLELGAAPGGITRLLASRAAVTAIDLAPLHPQVADHGRVVAIEADVHVWSPDDGVRFGGLLCDINGPHEGALAATERALAWLRPDAPCIVTLKLAGWSHWPQRRAAIRQRLEAAGCSGIAPMRTSAHRDRELAVVFAAPSRPHNRRNATCG